MKCKKHTGAGTLTSGGSELTAVTGVTDDAINELTVDDTIDSEFITGSVCGVSCLYTAATGDKGLVCDISCLVKGTSGPCVDNFVALMLSSSSVLIHKPHSSHNIHCYTDY